ncbi:hypothetical protein [Geodermatophilus sp. CPCC 206100]|uniref:hypothetical protein n=1 Tax=Geodermatophilus sp. CPCC 206100 TaxID=3020054 RepID=UPI003B00F467
MTSAEMTRPIVTWDGAPATRFPADPYPGQRPDGSFLVADGRVRQVWADPTARSGWACGNGLDLGHCLAALDVPGIADRAPVLAYGSNANPAKIDGLRLGPVVALRVTTTHLAAAWCTHPRGDGQIPATLIAAPGVVETHHVLLCTAAQVRRLDRVEGRAAGIYVLGVLRPGSVTLEDGSPVEGVLAYVGGRGRQPLADAAGRPLLLTEVDQGAAARAARDPIACWPEVAVDLTPLAG